MNNFFEQVLKNPGYYRQFKCGKSLITAFTCPMEARLMKTRFSDLWTQYNYLFYVIGGEKKWHTARGSYHIQQESCVFVRKGGFILEQVMDIGFCVMLFFIPDEFIRDTLYERTKPLAGCDENFDQLLLLDTNETLKGFFLSMYSYYTQVQEPDNALLEIKFKELILNIAGNNANAQLQRYFSSLLHGPQAESMKRVMEDNFCYNLKLETYAGLCNRSLSAFKRDFEKLFLTSPGKWLLEKRLHHALHLLQHHDKAVSDVAFESGFESNAHFSRAFKTRFGLTPMAIKKERKLQ